MAVEAHSVCNNGYCNVCKDVDVLVKSAKVCNHAGWRSAHCVQSLVMQGKQ